MADGRTGRGSDDGGGDGNVDGGRGGVNLGSAIDGINGSRCLRARKGRRGTRRKIWAQGARAGDPLFEVFLTINNQIAWITL